MKNKILDDLNKTGFISELYVAQRLSEMSWDVKLNDSYFDKDIEASREIDVIATKKALEPRNNLLLCLNLIIEVKKTVKPWIVFTNEYDKGKVYKGLPGWTLIHGGENYILEKGGGLFSPQEIHEKIMRVDSKRIGKAFHESFKSPTETSKIFQSIICACKAAKDKSEIFPKEHSNMKNFNSTDHIYVEFYHPMVIVDGPLYEVYLDEKNEIRLEEKNWIPVTYEYSSKKYGSGSGRSISFYPDIVKFNYIDEYIGLVDIWLESMKVNFDNKIDIYNSKRSPPTGTS